MRRGHCGGLLAQFGFLQKQTLRQGFDNKIIWKGCRTLAGEAEEGKQPEGYLIKPEPLQGTGAQIRWGILRAHAEHALSSYPQRGEGPGAFMYHLLSVTG